MVGKAALASLLAIMAGPVVFAQEWANKMFETSTHDFGSIARGAKAEYGFVLTNIYAEDVHIAGARANCGCTSVTVKQPLLKTYEKGEIVARINSDSFRGRQGATISVTLDRPRYAQLQLHVTVYVRGDVVFDPPSVEIGSVNQGTAVEKTVSVAYAGRMDWQIVSVRSANPHLSGKVIEKARHGRQVSYELHVRLDEDAPAGYMKDQIVLITNDRQTAEIPILVEGRILSNISVSPSSLFLGVVGSGETVTKQLVVQGKSPFRILSVTCDCNCFKLPTAFDNTAKLIHVIPVTFTAGDGPGKVVKTIRIKTDLDQAATELSTYAAVASKQ